MSVTVNGQAVPLHCTAGQLSVLFPNGLLGLRDPQGNVVMPNADGSVDFSIIGNYYIPAMAPVEASPPPRRPAPAPPREGGHSGGSVLLTPQYPLTSSSHHRHHDPNGNDGNMRVQFPQRQSPHRIGEVLSQGRRSSLSPSASRCQRQQSMTPRATWNSDTHIEYDDPPLVLDPRNKAMGVRDRVAAKCRYRFRPHRVDEEEQRAREQEARRAQRQQELIERYAAEETPRPRRHYAASPPRVGSLVESKRHASPKDAKSRQPPLDAQRYMALKYGYKALTDDVLKRFRVRAPPSSPKPTIPGSRVGMDLYSQPKPKQDNVSLLDDGPPSRLTAFILAEKNSVPTGRGLWRTLPRDVNAFSYSVP